jgi:chorismate mutase
VKIHGSINAWRGRIDHLNRAILALLNRRVRAARRIGLIKRVHGLPVTDAAREREVLRRAIRHNRGPLDAAGIRRIFGVIIRETKRLERKAARG